MESSKPAIPGVEQPPAEQGKSPALEFVTEMVKTVALALILYFIISAVTDRVRVENISMQPTLYEGQLLVISKLSYVFGEPHRGDIIVFHHTQQPPEDYIKRVIGLPGDHVEIDGEKVMVNGVTLNEPYIAAEPDYVGTWDVPAGQLFVLGDNRNRSSNSHVWGFVPESTVVGRAVLIYWPLNKLAILSHKDLLQSSP